MFSMDYHLVVTIVTPQKKRKIEEEILWGGIFQQVYGAEDT